MRCHFLCNQVRACVCVRVCVCMHMACAHACNLSKHPCGLWPVCMHACAAYSSIHVARVHACMCGLFEHLCGPCACMHVRPIDGLHHLVPDPPQLGGLIQAVHPARGGRGVGGIRDSYHKAKAVQVGDSWLLAQVHLPARGGRVLGFRVQVGDSRPASGSGTPVSRGAGAHR